VPLEAPQPLLTAIEIARLLGVSKQWVYKWTEQGKLPCVRLPGRTIRYDAAEVERYVESLKRTSPVVHAAVLPFVPPNKINP